MPQEKIIQVLVEQDAPRLDQYLAGAIPNLSRSQIQKLIRQGKVALSEPRSGELVRATRPGSSVHTGAVIILRMPLPKPTKLEPEELPIDVLFEDDYLVVVNKPAGMVVHPGHGHARGTLVNALLARYPDLAGLTQTDKAASDRPGIVHRLDRDTSGLLVVARTPAALKHLRRQFKARTVEKTYLALVIGRLAAPEGVIDVPLGRDPRHRQKFTARANGKPARTHYRLLERLDPYSLLEIGLETGRTHQIRVHLAWLKCPVVGDTVYGPKKNRLGLKRQFLHAWRLRFQHPGSGELLQLEAPLDKELKTVLNQLNRG